MKYYMVGIKGTGMSALALILSDLGYEVVGYDDAADHRFTEDKLLERGIKIYNEAYKELTGEHVVIYSPALVLDEHPELIRAQAHGCVIYEYEDFLGKLTKKFNTICISGCHGKTTTTSMLSHILNNINGCSYLIGDGQGKGNRESDRFILEACEYRRHFLAYDPEYVVITNIEMDHTDYYKSMDDMILAYQEFANKASKMVIACGDDVNTRYLEVNPQMYYYGIGEDNDIQARDIEYRDTGTSFDVFVEDEYYGHFDLPLYGKHMLLNALAVIAICHYERIDAKDVAKHLKTFKGALRRFKETKVGNSILIDDYAHHPTEVKVTIKAARQKYPDKKIIAIFKPHTFSRVEEFQNEFAEALNLADYAYVMDINYDREKVEDYPGIDAYTIINKLDNGDYLGMDEASKLLAYEDAVFVFMSSKEIYLLEDKFKKLLEEK